jgi:hypothetical protein
MSATNTVAMISCALPETSSPVLAKRPYQFPTVTLLTDGVHPVAGGYFRSASSPRMTSSPTGNHPYEEGAVLFGSHVSRRLPVDTPTRVTARRAEELVVTAS